MARPVRKPAGLEIFWAAGPARELQSSNCNLTTGDFCGGRPSKRAAGQQQAHRVATVI